MTTMVHTSPSETTPRPRAPRRVSSGNGLEKRVAQLEAEVVLLRAALQELLPVRRQASGHRASYAWVTPPAHLQGLHDYAQLDAEQLVYIHELTAEDVYRRLQELEQQHHISSAEFYRRWQNGEADDITEKIEWSLLYENWLRINAGHVMPEVAP